jgi:hypothetical protein
VAWNKLESLYQPTNTKTCRQRKPSWSPMCSRSYYTAPNVVAHGEGKEATPNLSAEDGTENTASLWSDRATNTQVQQRTSMSDVVVVALTLKWKWEGLVARTDQRRWARASPVWDVIIGERRTQRPKSR